MLRKGFLVFCFLTGMTALYADIYKWTDSSGDVHFSDKPRDGAEKVMLPNVQSYSSPTTPPSQNASTNPRPASTSTDAGMGDDVVYKQLNIVQPEDQQTIRNPQGYVSVILEPHPHLKKGDSLQIILDGTPLDKPKDNTLFALQNITRGSHTLAAQLIDANGKVILTSDVITIYMMPPRVGMVKG